MNVEQQKRVIASVNWLAANRPSLFERHGIGFAPAANYFTLSEEYLYVNVDQGRITVSMVDGPRYTLRGDFEAHTLLCKWHIRHRTLLDILRILESLQPTTNTRIQE